MAEQDKSDLYRSFGDLIYAIAMADGILQEEEKNAIRKIIGDHAMMPFVDESLNRKVKEEISIVSAYYKVMNYIKENKPDPEFHFLLQVLEALSKLSAGVDEDDENLMEDFIADLRSRLK